MSDIDQTSNETSTAPEATPAAPVRKRAPALTATVNGEAHKLLKYAFPTKAITFGVQVNGVEAQAASTAGRGAAYTYLLINNTGFYLPKGVLLASGDSITVDFPEVYEFDNEQAVRVSTYKPKAKRVAAEGEDGAAEPGDEPGAETVAVEGEAYEESAPAPRASRRGRK